MEGCSFVTLSFNILDMSQPIMDVLAHSCGEIIRFCQHLPLKSLLYSYTILPHSYTISEGLIAYNCDDVKMM